MRTLIRNACAVWILLAAACDTPTTVVHHEHATQPAFAHVKPGQLVELAQEVRQAISRFHSTTLATSAGYVEDSPCIAESGLGGMGFHFVNHGLVDPVFDAMNPEALLYEQAKNGQFRLTGVEYIVIDIGQPAPTFDGQTFDVGGSPVPVPHWTLHVWLNKENPSGVFAPFNPDVTCE